MADDTTAFLEYDGTNGPIGATETTRAELITAIEQMNPTGLVSALQYLSSNGIIARTGTEAFTPRTITGDSLVTVTNGDGVSGNPTLTLGSAASLLTYLFFTGAETISSAANPSLSNTLPVTILTATGTPTCTLAAPSAGGIKVIVNTSAVTNTITITNYQTSASATDVDYSAGGGLVSNSSLVLYSNATNWYPLAGYFQT